MLFTVRIWGASCYETRRVNGIAVILVQQRNYQPFCWIANFCKQKGILQYELCYTILRIAGKAIIYFKQECIDMTMTYNRRQDASRSAHGRTDPEPLTPDGRWIQLGSVQVDDGISAHDTKFAKQ